MRHSADELASDRTMNANRGAPASLGNVVLGALWRSVLMCGLVWSLGSGMVRGQQPEARPVVEPERDGESGADEPADPFAEHLETDRDSFTPSARTVGWRRSLVETSHSFVDQRRAVDTHSFPELLVRIGLTDRIELRLGGNYEVGGEPATVSGVGGHSGLSEAEGTIVRESQCLYGAKFGLTDQANWRPTSSLIVQGHTPLSGPEPATALQVAYVVGWELPGEWQVDSAMRLFADSEHGDRFETWAPSVVVRQSPAERWNVHAEYFGQFSQNRRHEFVRHVVSPGVHYLLTPDIELGVRVGWGLNDQTARFFSNVGLGVRF